MSKIWKIRTILKTFFTCHSQVYQKLTAAHKVLLYILYTTICHLFLFSCHFLSSLCLNILCSTLKPLFYWNGKDFTRKWCAEVWIRFFDGAGWLHIFQKSVTNESCDFQLWIIYYIQNNSTMINVKHKQCTIQPIQE